MSAPKPWSAEEIKSYAERYGVTGLNDEALGRLREIADKVAIASAKIPRVPRKDDEPAPVFHVPLR